MLVYEEQCLFISFTRDIFMALIMEGQHFYNCMDIEAEANFCTTQIFVKSNAIE